MNANNCVSKASAGGLLPRSRWKNLRFLMFRNHVCTEFSSKPQRSANFCFSWDDGYGFDACSRVHFSSMEKLSEARHSANVRTGKVLPLLGPPPLPLPYWEAILGLFGREAAAAAMCETGLTLFEASSSDRCTFSCSVGGSGWLVIVVGMGEARAAHERAHEKALLEQTYFRSRAMRMRQRDSEDLHDSWGAKMGDA